MSTDSKNTVTVTVTETVTKISATTGGQVTVSKPPPGTKEVSPGVYADVKSFSIFAK